MLKLTKGREGGQQLDSVVKEHFVSPSHLPSLSQPLDLSTANRHTNTTGKKTDKELLLFTVRGHSNISSSQLQSIYLVTEAYDKHQWLYTMVHKKRTSKFLLITLANFNRFQ